MNATEICRAAKISNRLAKLIRGVAPVKRRSPSTKEQDAQSARLILFRCGWFRMGTANSTLRKGDGDEDPRRTRCPAKASGGTILATTAHHPRLWWKLQRSFA